MKASRILMALPTLAAAALLISGCGQNQVAASTKAPPPPKLDTYLTIVTPDQTGKDNYPAFTPSNFTLPANSLVTVHVANFDDPDDMSADNLVSYTKVMGTVGGTVTVQAFSNDNPNTLQAGQTSTQLDPKAGVSHTLTIAGLNLNVPIAPHAVTTFTIKTGAAGTYDWLCMVPCGTDPNGNGGPMVAAGYMRGTLTVA